MRPSAGRKTSPSEAVSEWTAGTFPASLYLEGPDEAVKHALIAELKRSWAARHPESPRARVFRAGESGVDEILAASQSVSLFSSGDLVLVLEIEDIGRSEKKVTALADGLAHAVATSCLVLIESAAESARASLAPLRAAASRHLTAVPARRAELTAWAARRLEREGITAEAAAIEALADASEGDSVSFFNELDKLCAWASREKPVRRSDIEELLRPVIGADLPEYLAAVAAGDPGLSIQRLGRLLASGASEGTVLFALSNLVGGALGGWARHRELSDVMRRRRSPGELSQALEAVYRVEAAWKGGRVDPVAGLEQATRELCGL